MMLLNQISNYDLKQLVWQKLSKKVFPKNLCPHFDQSVDNPTWNQTWNQNMFEQFVRSFSFYCTKCGISLRTWLRSGQNDRCFVSKMRFQFRVWDLVKKRHYILIRVDWVYYESKREPKIRGMNKCRCDERLQTKTTSSWFTSIRLFFFVFIEKHERMATVKYETSC